MSRRGAAPRAGSDRGRVGERLQASLAGLLELELLRDTQRGAVAGALGRAAPQVKDPLPPAQLDRSRSDDLLEASEADSRPSSGFYETSEMGSLSDSCSSVLSDGAGSRGSLSWLPGPRPHSMDEAATRILDLQLRRLMAVGAPARRPVSTGDLDFLLSLGELGPRCRPYKCDLVSRSTSEIYCYPSPLHAVALQSPLFTSGLSRDPSQEDLREEEAMPAAQNQPALSEEQRQVRLERYISKLVLRYRCRAAEPTKSQALASVCGSPPGAGPAPGWKLRRRISTCSHLRSPEAPSATSLGSLLEHLSLGPEPESSSMPACQPEALARGQGVGERLYRGKHASRELVRAAEGAERGWLGPRELLRRLSLRRRREGSHRCGSEGNVCPAGPGRPKWASVLEISSVRAVEPCLPPRRRPLALSTDSCFLGSGSTCSLGEEDAGSLAEEWRPPASGRALTLRTGDPGGTKLQRARSLKELKRMVRLSLRPAAHKASK